jgi:hypothetical protein
MVVMVCVFQKVVARGITMTAQAFVWPRVVPWVITMVAMVPVWGSKSALRATITAAIMCVRPMVFALRVSTMMARVLVLP